jgi:hypothetical protein
MQHPSRGRWLSGAVVLGVRRLSRSHAVRRLRCPTTYSLSGPRRNLTVGNARSWCGDTADSTLAMTPQPSSAAQGCHWQGTSGSKPLHRAIAFRVYILQQLTPNIPRADC